MPHLSQIKSALLPLPFREEEKGHTIHPHSSIDLASIPYTLAIPDRMIVGRV